MDRNITIGGVEFNLKLSFVIVLTTIVPMLDHYKHRLFSYTAYDRFFYYFVISAVVILFLFGDDIRDYGFKLGNWREGLLWTIGVCLVIGTFLWFFARTPEMQAYYEARAADNVGRIIWLTSVELFGWEFIWRGFLLFGLARYLGPGPAIFLQAVPFAFMHLGKPEIETLSTILGGAGFGFVAWRTQSFVYPWLIHWFMVAFTMTVAAGFLG
ncbi:MAG: type II CAAX prenyl endopeptidase Rce1 family protein [Candidatus Promineifilaceae bacterium]